MQRRSGVYPSHAQCPPVARWYCWLMLAALCLVPGCSCSSADDPNNPTATATDPSKQTPEEKAAAEKKALAEKRAEEERLKKLPFERLICRSCHNSIRNCPRFRTRIRRRTKNQPRPKKPRLPLRISTWSSRDIGMLCASVAKPITRTIPVG